MLICNLQESDDYYSFTNIRYAAPPTGNLRFAKPVKPQVDRSAIQDGSTSRICPQAAPAWGLVAQQFVPLYLQDPLGFNVSDLNVAGGDIDDGEPPVAPTPDPRETEDCLFLDVYVPASILESQYRRYGGRGKGAKVIVWIHGGGFVGGSKDITPGNLLETSEEIGDDGPIIYVSINYRLGALGWSSGPSFEEAGGVSNVGLYDQRMALQWVRRYIDSFGGDCHDVTVIGESAGGSSIMHQITVSSDILVLYDARITLVTSRHLEEDKNHYLIKPSFSHQASSLPVHQGRVKLHTRDFSSLPAPARLKTSVLFHPRP